MPSLRGVCFYDRAFSPLITLWYFLFQRLHHDHTLDAAVTDAVDGGADCLKPGLSTQLTSEANAAFCKARQRLGLAWLQDVLEFLSQRIWKWSPRTLLWNGLVVSLLDGSTLRLRAHPAISSEFPPVKNQHGESAWCLMHVVASFCAFSGIVSHTAMDSKHVSEQVMACKIILQAKLKTLFVGDRNFGIFRILQAVRQAKQHALVRLTLARVRRILGTRRLKEGDHPVLWTPTRHDQQEKGCDAQPLRGRILVAKINRPGFRSFTLCLFTDLESAPEYSMEALVRIYALRWNVELNLRYLKAQMDLSYLNCKTPLMAKKEWVAGLIAYNLIRAAQLAAALNHGISPLTLSFSESRRRFEQWLRKVGYNQRAARTEWPELLQRIAKCKLPNRRKRRPSEPRAKRHLREEYPPLRGSRSQARKDLKKAQMKS